MKKSKIIIPAAAILALSVGASVTGTVAWFTASNRANVTANNLAVINAQGALSVTNTKVTGCEVVSDGTVKLEYLQDASYDYIEDNAFVAVLDTDGKNVVGSREVSKTTSRPVAMDGGTKYIYYVAQWISKFNTTSVEKQYLYFDNHDDKSHISGYDTLDTESVYRALRVSMVCGSSRILWAPYTTETPNIYYINSPKSITATAIDSPEDVKQAFITANATGNTAVLSHGLNNVKEGDSINDASNHSLLLSTALISSTPVEVTTTVWFEGLDPKCIEGKEDINTIAAHAMNKVLSLSFYSVTESTLNGYNPAA